MELHRLLEMRTQGPGKTREEMSSWWACSSSMLIDDCLANQQRNDSTLSSIERKKSEKFESLNELFDTLVDFVIF